MTEKEKMLAGEPYYALDPQLLSELNAMKDMVWEYNSLRPSMRAEREAMLRRMIGSLGSDPLIVQPFYCDYGSNMCLGDRFFANFGFTVLDEARVSIGHNAFIGPNVGIYTACHPTDAAERNRYIEWARPVSIGDNVWIGGGVTICPGVSIGHNVTIGAGSVVVHDISDNCVAVGNPARVVRHLPAQG